MKKTLCIIMSLLLLANVTVPISAFSVGDGSEDVMLLTNCNHSSYTSSYYYTYIDMNKDYHEVYRTERRQCNVCSDIIYTGTPVAMPLESHSGSWEYVRSVHDGDVSEHYYIYSSTCSVCFGTYEEYVPSLCRINMCVDPYSLRMPEYAME